MDHERADWKVRLSRTHVGSNAMPLSCKFSTAYALIIPQSDHRLHARAGVFFFFFSLDLISVSLS